MSGKSVGPRPGSVTMQVLERLGELGQDGLITSEQIAALAGVPIKQVNGLLKWAVHKGWLDKTSGKHGILAYRLPSQEQPAFDDEPVEFEIDDVPIVRRVINAASAAPLFRPAMASSVFHLGGLL